MSLKSKRRSKRGAVREEQLHLPLEDFDIRHNLKLRGVYRDEIPFDGLS